ncbi:MAG: hypothetical protein CMM01_20965 [Rhodopirellula sp.]|nr:hypothetical protein [Rhodopirellula sp.]
MVDEPTDRGKSDSPYEAKLKANWQTGKKKAVQAADNPGEIHAEPAGQNIKLHLMVWGVAILTTIMLFVIVFWDDWPLLDLLFF